MYLSRLGSVGAVAIYPITQGEWMIGRDPNVCRIVVPAEFGAVGRVHARFVCDAVGACQVQGLHANGTYVNDKLLNDADLYPVRAGDVITLAGTRASKPARCSYTLTEHPMQLPRVPSTNDLLGENATILALIANPAGTSPLRLDEEMRAVDLAILAARYRDQLDMRQCSALRLSDLQAAVLRYTPSIVHFSGHGSPQGSIILAADDGKAVPVPPAALSNFFRAMSPPVRCVVLNACFTRIQGRAIAKHVPCVIGMSRAISDTAAIHFATGFYQALAYGYTVKKAFELGRNAIEIQGAAVAHLGRREAVTPVLLADPDVADRLRFTYDITGRG
jgi:hypothetical protein